MNLKDRFPFITSICFSPTEKHLYVFTKGREDLKNLSLFLETTYFFPYSILEEHTKTPKGTSFASLELNNYTGFCTYLYKLETSKLQLELLLAEFEYLISEERSDLITNLVGNLNFTKLIDSSLTFAQLEEALALRLGVPKAHSLLGIN